MAFRYSGTAWDGQKWRVAKSVETLGNQIMDLRGTTTSFGADGTVASKAHDQNNPNSDHTVKPKIGSGVVYAIDFQEERLVVDDVLNAIRLSKDNRVLYGIHDSQMFSSYPTSAHPAWTWRPYGGSNGHPDHGHLSVQNNLAISDDPRPWAIQLGGPSPGDEMIEELTEGLKADPARIDRLVDDGIIGGVNPKPYWRGKLANTSDPEWKNFWSQVFVETALRAGSSAGGGAVPLTISLTGKATP